MALVCFKNTLGKQSDFQQIDKPTLMTTILDYSRNNDELHELISSQKMVIYLNGKTVKVDDWQETAVSEDDEIVLSPAILGGDNAGWINVAIGAVMIVAGVITQNPMLIMAGASMVLGGVSALLFEPDLPKLPSRSSSSQTYNWNGISTNSKTDIPVPVIYGTHSVGGNIVSIYTQTRNYDEYLYVLLGLGEGEIEGIYKHESDEVMTEYYCNDGSDYSPDILIDGQPIKYYKDWEMWWRPGLNVQTQIPGFDGTKLLYQVGDEVTDYGLVYRTQGDVDLVTCTLECPSLYTVDSGEIKPYKITYKVRYKAAAAGTYTDLPITKYVPSTSSATNGGQIGQCKTISYRYGQDYWYGTSQPQSITIRVISNSYQGLKSHSYVIKMEVTSGDGTVLNDDLKITNSVKYTKVLNPDYVSTGSAKTDADAGQRKYLYVWQDTPVAFSAGIYIVKLYGSVNAGNRFTMTSTIDDDSEVVVMYDKSKTGLTSVIDINFRSLGLDQGVYDIKFKRTDGGKSDDFSTENTLNLESVLEQIQGKYTYPNTALMGMKLKASGQISGNVPSMVTKIKGRIIPVPDLGMTATTFDDCYWDGSSWRINEVGSPIKTWDGTTWTEEHSHNSMLCVRDLVVNKRYGLGQYMTATDLNTVGVNEAVQECHRWYNIVPSHFHQFDGVLESEQTALTVLNEMCSSFRVWPVWIEGALDFVLDKDTTPVHTIAKSNTVGFAQSFVPLSEIPYKAYGQYTDEDNDYDMRSLLALSNVDNLLKLNETTIGLKGITNFDRASRELKFKLNKVINCTETINFRCGLDKIHAAAGDLIYVQNDLPQWGYGGRVMSYDMSTASLLVDEDVTLGLISETHTIRFVDENGETQEGTLNLSGKTNYEAYRTFSLDSHVGTPADDAVFTVGRAGGEPKEFRIMSISRSQEDEVDITALEHLATLYNEPDIGIVEDDYSDLPNPNEVPGPPRVMSIQSYDEALGFYIKALPPINSTGVVSIQVQISANGITFVDIGTLVGPDWTMLYTDAALMTNTTYYFRLFCKTATKSGDYVIAEAELSAPEYIISPPTGVHIKGKTPNVQTFNGRDVAIAWNAAGMIPGQSATIHGYIVDVFHLANRSDVPSESNFRSSYTVNSEEFEYTFEENDRNTNGTGIGWPTIAFVVYTLQTNGGISTGATPFVVNNTVPNPVQGLQARPFMAQVQFWWTKVNIPDFATYEYRYKVESFGEYSDWEDSLSPNILIGLSTSDRASNYDDIYLDVRVRDIFNQPSTTNSIIQTADSIYVSTTDVEGFEETMSGNFFYIPVLDGDAWTNNNPTGTEVSWNAHSVWLNGTEYAIAAGNTAHKYIYWESLGSSYSTSDTHPGENLVTDQDFIIGTNISGTFKRAWGAIPNQAIGSAYIQNAAIQDAHIDSLSAAKIRAGTIMTPGVYIGDAVNSDGVAIDDLTATTGGDSLSGADWSTNLTGIPDRFSDSPGALPGLYITSTHMGYHEGGIGDWTSYINDEGDFFFGTGTTSTDKFLFWDSSAGSLKMQTDETGGMKILNGGSLEVDGGGSISVADGGNISVSEGGDILLYASSTDYSAIYFYDENDALAGKIWCTAGGSVKIGSETDRTMYVWLGDETTRLRMFMVYATWQIWMETTDASKSHQVWMQMHDSLYSMNAWGSGSSNSASINLTHDASYVGGPFGVTNHSIVVLHTTEGGVSQGVALHSNGFKPEYDNRTHLGVSGYRWKSVWAVDTSINSSDEREKTNIETIPLGLSFVNYLDPISFVWKDEGVRSHYGFSAQSVKGALDEFGISTSKFAGYIYDDETDAYALRLSEFIPIIWSATKELSDEIEKLKARVKELEESK